MALVPWICPLFFLCSSIAPCSGFLVQRTYGHASRLQGSSSSTANVGEIIVTRPGDEREYRLSYKIARPMALSSLKAAPIVVLHGGMSLPSDYLYPLEQCIPYRSIVFYDQLGCGRSSQPIRRSSYSIDYAIDDLEALLKKLGLRRFHLYGHSCGGVLAFEYMKRRAERDGNRDYDDDAPVVLSAILSSAPVSIPESDREWDRLLSVLATETDPDCAGLSLDERFRRRHQCRTTETPLPLRAAYAGAGTVWFGTEAIRDYRATKPADGAKRMPSTLILRGEYDFVGKDCSEGWKDVFNHKFLRFKTLPGCSHHALLENGAMYGDIIDSYFTEYD